MATTRKKLDDLVIGDHDCPKSDVLAAIVGSSSFGRLHEKWGSLAIHIGIPDHEIRKLSKDYLFEIHVKTLSQLVNELLLIWKAEKGDQAKLVDLCEALEKCSLADISHALSKKFGNVACGQGGRRFLWDGKQVTVDDLLPKEMAKMSLDLEVNTNKRSKLSLLEATPIIRPQFAPPAQPKYYVPRTLSFIASNELDTAIFASETTRNHVFLFSGISKEELGKLTQYKHFIKLSGDQLYDVSVRFILLEDDDDFDWICGKTTKPVHMIQLKKERYLWVKSNKNLDLIRRFLKKPPEDLSEQDLASKIISLPSPYALSIADSPGMGKTMVLANLATKIQEKGTNYTIHLFIVLQEFIQHIPSLDSSSSALESIVAYSSSDQVTATLLSKMMKTSQYQIYLFLDAYDEVPQAKLDLVDTFLEYVKDLPNFKVIVTTRTHMKTRLEGIFHQFAFEIHPFTEPNQISFLTHYWVDRHQAKFCEQLEQFALMCLSALRNNISNEEREIAGIPLICMMLGDIFAKQARRACRLKYLRPNSVPQIAFIQLYETLIELKFSRIQEPSAKQNYVHAHVLEAVKLLVPDWIRMFETIIGTHEDIDEATMYSIGLVVKSPTTRRFIHRTFAEYLLANFIVDNVGKYATCVDLFVGEILGRNGTIEKFSEREDLLKIYKLKYPVIAYFIDMHMKKRSIDELLIPYFPTSTSFNGEDLCVSIRACCNNELESILNYTIKLLDHLQLSIDKIFGDQFFKDLPYVVAKYCDSAEMLEKVLEFTNQYFGVKIDYYVKENYRVGGRLPVNYCTPLHVAVHGGKYNMVTWLVQQYGDQVKQLRHLLHVCVFWSAGDNDSVIENKQLIIDMLASINPSWVNEEKDDRFICVPLLQFNVHLNLLKWLLQNGAHINEYSSRYGTVLHQTTTKSTYTRLVQWAFSSGFKLINRWDHERRTPIMRALEKFGAMEDDVLQMFIKGGVNLNAEDKNGDSVLFYALQYAGNIDFVRKLMDSGADVNHRNKKNQNAVHKLMQGWKVSSETTLETLDLLVGINSNFINDIDQDECTPLLMHGMLPQVQRKDFRLLRRLVEYGADINAYSNIYGTVLHGFSYDKRTYTDLARWAFSNGFNLVNHKDQYNRNPLVHSIKHFGILDFDDEVFKLFLEQGAQLDVKDDIDFIKYKVPEMIDRPTSFGRLHAKCRSVALHLGIPDHIIHHVADESIMKVKINTLSQFVDWVASLWETKKIEPSNIVDLCDSLENCERTDVIQSLLLKFENVMCPPKMQLFIWEGKLVTVDKLLRIDHASYEFEQSKCLQIINQKLFNPITPKLYVPMTVLFDRSIEIDSALFLSETFQDHLFLFSNITKPELAKLNRRKFRNKTRSNTFYVRRFILLESEDHFKRICEETDKPVHIIKYEPTQRYFWIKSNRNLDVIQPFLKDTANTIISEKGLAFRIVSLPPPWHIIIGGSCGMGKTSVLTNVAQIIQENSSSNAIHLFIELQEFIQQVHTFDSSSSALEVIAIYSSSDRMTKKLLYQMMKESHYQVYLYLDGYDEMLGDKLQLVDTFLNAVQQLRNFKVILTTRSHMKKRLEIIFNQVSYFELHPSNESDRTNFLTRYWVDQHGARKCEVLEQFARQCLKALQENISDEEKQIAGIPLQCMMLGEVFAKDAKHASSLKHLPSNSVEPISFMQLLKRFINLKFVKIPGGKDRQNYLHAHVYRAIRLLFPAWTVQFETILRGHHEVDETTMYSIGLIEHNVSTTPKFLHRTFAEYLLAVFLINHLQKQHKCVELLFAEIIKGTEFKLRGEFCKKKEKPQFHEQRYPVMVYFINMYQKESSADADQLFVPDNIYQRNSTKKPSRDGSNLLQQRFRQHLQRFRYVTRNYLYNKFDIAW